MSGFACVRRRGTIRARGDWKIVGRCNDLREEALTRNSRDAPPLKDDAVVYSVFDLLRTLKVASRGGQILMA